MKKNILGIKIDDINIDQAESLVESWLAKPGKHYVVTPNPEFLVAAQSDKEFKEILNNADLAVADGAGLKLSGDIVCICPGTDLMEGLIKLAAEKGFTTGFLGGREMVAERVVERLKKRYPKLKVTFAGSGGEVDEEGENTHTTSYILPTTDILFVAFGPPKQEKWIAKNIKKLDIKVAMGVGGAFDYISGDVFRAPHWVRSIGFEWLFRLIIQPWRIRRQLALVKYIWLLTKQKLGMLSL